jgi:hypothetical protein
MSGWEIFTWVNAWILGCGAVIVFVWFLIDLPGLLPGAERRTRTSEDGEG